MIVVNQEESTATKGRPFGLLLASDIGQASCGSKRAGMRQPFGRGISHRDSPQIGAWRSILSVVQARMR